MIGRSMPKFGSHSITAAGASKLSGNSQSEADTQSTPAKVN
jgi:hypothetical protein